jgi:hypothetical protein
VAGVWLLLLLLLLLVLGLQGCKAGLQGRWVVMGGLGGLLRHTGHMGTHGRGGSCPGLTLLQAAWPLAVNGASWAERWVCG